MELFDPEYRGARFYKCDFHMHTPLDRHWRDESTRLTIADKESRKEEVARQYLRACLNAGLQVIGVTDHNFARVAEQSFVRYLREQNEVVARELGRPPLIILPGFEIEADVGKGFHVICLFDCDVELAVVDARLTSCGLPTDMRFKPNGEPIQSTKRLPDIIKVVQEHTLNSGLVIAAHPASAKGMLNDDSVEMWLQQEEFRNPSLLCIEVPKPVEALSTGWQKLLKSGESCSPEWRRERPIACVQISDSYQFRETDGATANYIGFRFSWVKLSQPSIEGLRQAFLDHASRIRLLDSSPEERYVHPIIQEVEVKGATFYRAGKIQFSPNLNTIIGSRGAGKSTLLDYMRLALDRLRPGDLPKRLADEINQKLKDTLSGESRITIEFMSSSTPYRLEYTRSPESRVITRLDTGESQVDWSIRELLPVRVLSQREIDQSVDPTDQTPLRRLLDDFIAPELASLSQMEREVKSAIKSLDVAIISKQEGQALRGTLLTQKLELESRLDRLDSVRAPLEHWTTIEKEIAVVDSVAGSCQSVIDALETAEAGICQLNASQMAGYPHEELLRQVIETASSAATTLKERVHVALQEFRTATQGPSSVLQKLIQDEWVPIREEESRKYQVLQQELENKGDRPHDYLRLKSQLAAIGQQLEDLDREKQNLTNLERDRAEQIANLRRTWNDQSQCRIVKAKELMDRLRPFPGVSPLVEIAVVPQGNPESVSQLWSTRLGDRRRLNESDISELIRWCISHPNGDPLSQQLLTFVRDPEMKPIIQGLLPSRAKALFETFSESTLRELELERADDAVAYRVYREDGSLAGAIGNVSAGQKGLAFLNLLLASGDMPLIVDTPEEGLDNEGVYTELVPIFRREKEKRQIFVVTHNANVPVNADAELIACLEPRGTIERDFVVGALLSVGQDQAVLDIEHLITLFAARNWDQSVAQYLQKAGCAEHGVRRFVEISSNNRTVDGRWRRDRNHKDGPLAICVGALDTVVVKRAVQDIMEGSEQAFIRRQEKYGF